MYQTRKKILDEKTEDDIDKSGTSLSDSDVDHEKKEYIDKGRQESALVEVEGT